MYRKIGQTRAKNDQRNRLENVMWLTVIMSPASVSIIIHSSIIYWKWRSTGKIQFFPKIKSFFLLLSRSSRVHLLRGDGSSDVPRHTNPCDGWIEALCWRRPDNVGNHGRELYSWFEGLVLRCWSWDNVQVNMICFYMRMRQMSNCLDPLVWPTHCNRK